MQSTYVHEQLYVHGRSHILNKWRSHVCDSAVTLPKYRAQSYACLLEIRSIEFNGTYSHESSRTAVSVNVQTEFLL